MREISARLSNAIIQTVEKIFRKIFIAIFQSTENYAHFEKKGQLHSLNISEVIYPKKCAYFNSRMPLVYNTLPDSKCSWHPNTAETCTAALSPQLSINLEQIEVENISLSHIRNLTTVW